MHRFGASVTTFHVLLPQSTQEIHHRRREVSDSNLPSLVCQAGLARAEEPRGGVDEVRGRVKKKHLPAQIRGVPSSWIRESFNLPLCTGKDHRLGKVPMERHQATTEKEPDRADPRLRGEKEQQLQVQGRARHSDARLFRQD
mmetsp:Transcript_31346/g.47609  ORF Transcript_31346/g.47609 Transcript_31346/m.47609 type:complete len:142 (+) Transcript_31346:263-688(+)